jgi:hypothetical protein
MWPEVRPLNVVRVLLQTDIAISAVQILYLNTTFHFAQYRYSSELVSCLNLQAAAFQIGTKLRECGVPRRCLCNSMHFNIQMFWSVLLTPGDEKLLNDAAM